MCSPHQNFTKSTVVYHPSETFVQSAYFLPTASAAINPAGFSTTSRILDKSNHWLKCNNSAGQILQSVIFHCFYENLYILLKGNTWIFPEGILLTY